MIIGQQVATVESLAITVRKSFQSFVIHACCSKDVGALHANIILQLGIGFCLDGTGNLINVLVGIVTRFAGMLRTLRERRLALLLLITNDLADVGGVSAQQEEKPDQHKSAYAAANGNEANPRTRLLAQFADKFSDDALVMDKYFALIGSSRRSDTLQQVQTALQHPKFSLENPNKARSLIGSFSRRKIAGTIFAPTKLWLWKVQPAAASQRLHFAFPMSCSRAAHRSQRLSVCLQMLSSTSSVW